MPLNISMAKYSYEYASLISLASWLQPRWVVEAPVCDLVSKHHRANGAPTLVSHPPKDEGFRALRSSHGGLHDRGLDTVLVSLHKKLGSF